MSVTVRRFDCTPEQVFAVLADPWVYPSWVVGASRLRAAGPSDERPARIRRAEYGARQTGRMAAGGAAAIGGSDATGTRSAAPGRTGDRAGRMRRATVRAAGRRRRRPRRGTRAGGRDRRDDR